MKGLPIFPKSPKESGYHQQNSEDPNNLSFLTRIRRIFQGPPKAPAPLVYREEKKYKHQPTHSGSSFIKTTTTAAMVEAHVQQADDITLAGDETDGMETSSRTGPERSLI
jgi:hypothetical protein